MDKKEIITRLKNLADHAVHREGEDTFLISLDDGIALHEVVEMLGQMPSVQSEPLTDKEKRIFLAAMGREEKVCEDVDRKYVREPYEDSLVRVCREIRRKVIGALWT